MIDWRSNPASWNYPDVCLNRPAFRRSKLRLYGVLSSRLSDRTTHQSPKENIPEKEIYQRSKGPLPTLLSCQENCARNILQPADTLPNLLLPVAFRAQARKSYLPTGKGESLCYRRERRFLLLNSVSVSCPSASFPRGPRPSPLTRSSSARHSASLQPMGAASAPRSPSVTQRQFSGIQRVSLVTGPESRGTGSERHDRRNLGTAGRARFTPLRSLRDLNSHLRCPRRACLFSRVEHERTAPPIHAAEGLRPAFSLTSA